MWYDYFDSIIGTIYVVMDEKGVVKIELFQDGWEEYHNLNKGSLEHNKERCLRAITELKEYFNGEREDFNLPLSVKTTEFRNKVWQELINIPYGETRSYSDIAIAIGNPKGVRAIGGANRANEFPIIIPCHRVIGKSGKLVGYAGNHTDIKSKLLEFEKNNKDNLFKKTH